MTVSAYFHHLKYRPDVVEGMTVDEYVRENLPRTCQWTALRYTVFDGLMAGNSSVFWFQDTISDPVGWHLQWTRFAGLQLPMTVVESIAQAAVESGERFINEHIGGSDPSATRTWEDEVGADIVEGAGDILRTFLPPVLLARWGVQI